MAVAYPIGQRYVVTTADHGKFLVLGVPSHTAVGVWSVALEPSADFIGEFLVTARHEGKGAGDDSVGFGGIGYIRVQLNEAAADQGLTNDVLNGHAALLVRASGMSVALATECTQGTCTIYSTPLEGDVSPLSLVTA